MPSDPVKAVGWFMHWFLKILIRFFWLPILVMVVYEVYTNWGASGVGNALIEGFITLFVGGVVWAALYAILVAVNIATGIKQAVSDISRMQQHSLHRRSPFMNAMNADADVAGTVVEGTITDLEEERQKRRHD